MQSKPHNAQIIRGRDISGVSFPLVYRLNMLLATPALSSSHAPHYLCLNHWCCGNGDRWCEIVEPRIHPGFFLLRARALFIYSTKIVPTE